MDTKLLLVQELEAKVLLEPIYLATFALSGILVAVCFHALSV